MTGIEAIRQPASLPIEQPRKQPGKDTDKKGCQKNIENCSDLKDKVIQIGIRKLMKFAKLSAKPAKTTEGQKDVLRRGIHVILQRETR